MPAIRGGEISDLGDPIWGTSPKWDKRHIRDTLCTTMQNFTPIGHVAEISAKNGQKQT